MVAQILDLTWLSKCWRRTVFGLAGFRGLPRGGDDFQLRVDHFQRPGEIPAVYPWRP